MNDNNFWYHVKKGTPIKLKSMKDGDLHFYAIAHHSPHDPTEYIMTDMHGYHGFNECEIDNNREIIWIEHDQSNACPINQGSIVILEYSNGTLAMQNTDQINWQKVKKYRVIRSSQSTDAK